MMFHVKQEQRLPSHPLLLSGFMATGKSTVGAVLGSRLGVPFVDLDAAIEAEAGCSIPLIFSDQGEAVFRRMEAEALHRELNKQGARIIALGGGTLVDPGLRAFALAHGHVVTLTAKAETIDARVGAPRSNTAGRPLLDNEPDRLVRIHELLLQRKNAYAEAHAQVVTDNRTPDEIANIVEQAWLDPTLVVPLGPRSYAVRITDNPNEVTTELCRHLGATSAFVITDKNVDPLAATPLLNKLQAAGINVAKIVIEPGEESKSLQTIEAIANTLMEKGAHRNSILIALGGGVVSDITGFIAAIYHRGIPWIAVPTTLLSMVDAAVGGKTGVNLHHAKNILGAFHQPAGVIIDPTFVQTESKRAYTGGLAEVVKSAAIADPGLIELLANNAPEIQNRDPHLVAEMVRAATRVKTEIVTRDERETGDRIYLNFGHTLGHALETLSLEQGPSLTHGEAVSLGMVAILKIGVTLGITNPNDAATLTTLLATLNLPTNPNAHPVAQAITLSTRDKKTTGPTTRIVLLKTLGHMQTKLMSTNDLAAAWREAEGDKGSRP